MEIKVAMPEEYAEVRAFYHSLIDALAENNSPYDAGWEKDVYPSPEYLQETIAAKQLFIGREEGKIAAAMVLNHDYNESYEQFDWPTEASREEITVIHALGVHWNYNGKGFGKQLVQFAINRAKVQGQKAIRLDVLKGNVPANKLYENFGFQYLHTLQMFYEDTGWTDYELYELAL